MKSTKDRNTPERSGTEMVVPVEASTQIHAGTIVVANAAGNAIPGETKVGLTALGRAEHAVKNDGLEGEQKIRVKRGCFRFANDPTDLVKSEHLMKDCYIVDDQTVAATDGAGARSRAGKVVEVDSKGVWVEIR